MKNITYKMVQLSTPAELHAECVEWLSQLNFNDDEQRFLNELIRNYTVPLIANEAYAAAVKLVSELGAEENELKRLAQRVNTHMNNIEALLGTEKDQREEEGYRETHYYLKLDMHRYTIKYRKTKTELFDRIKKVIRNKKRNTRLS
ncbi:MAG: hypothetical protein R3359_01655 [Marinirhabdus sp.]|nr:hypothetical protein [Marinirhabdus sp.]